MDATTKKNFVLLIRIIVAALFVLSAVGKLSMDSLFDNPSFAITNFEKNYLVDGVGFSMGVAKVLSRVLIGIEFSIAILMLFPYYLKKIVIPGTILMLAIFSIHLAIQSISGDSSNCGCFGELIPMTPFQSLIKNLLTIGILILPLTIFKDVVDDKKTIHPLLHVGLSVVLLMFILLPQGGSVQTETQEIVSEGDVSGYGVYFDDVNEGNKLLCFFSPTCEHCMATGKKITELKNKYPGLIPEIRILFMDEAGTGSAEEVKQYFEFIGAEYTYKVLSIEEFLPIFWNDYNFPGVKYLYNGNQRIFFEGIEDNQFNSEKLLEAIRKEY